MLGVREVRWLSAARALSCLGGQFAQVAIALLVYDRTGSPLLAAIVYALTYLPPIVGGPLMSGLADLFPSPSSPSPWRADAGDPRQGVAQSGLYAVQGIGILAGGDVANVLGAPAAVGLSGIAGVLVAVSLAMSWTRLRGQVIASQRPSQDANALLTVPVDEGFQDRGTLFFVRQDRPRDQVKQDPEPVEDSEYPEREPNQVHVHPEVRSEPRSDTRDHPAVLGADKSLAPAAVVLTHMCDDAHWTYGLSSGIPLLLP